MSAAGLIPIIMAVPAYIVLRQARLIRRFRETGATDPAHAVNLEALGEQRSGIFNRMSKRGVFLPTQDGRFFMDVRAGDEHLRQLQKNIWLCAGIVALAILALGLFGR